MPLGQKGRKRRVFSGQPRSSPSALSLHGHRRGDGRRWAGQGHSSVGVDNRNNLAGPAGRLLLVVEVIRIGDSVNIGVGGSRREGNGGSDLLHWLDLVLQWRSIGGATRQRRAVGTSGVDGVQLRNR